MAKVIKFDDTIEYKIDRANDLYADENFADALTLLFEVVKRDEKNKDALILIGRIYADMNAFNESNVAYMTAYAKTKSKVRNDEYHDRFEYLVVFHHGCKDTAAESP